MAKYVAYVAVDDGHGMETAGKRTPYIKSLGRQIKENEFNREVAKYLKKELERNGFKVLMTAPTDKDTPLKQRTDLANREKVDIFISIHFNAFDGSFGGSNPEGFSAHIYLGHKNKEAGKLAQKIIDRLQGGTKQKNRGVVEQNLHVTRETNMPAVLLELGFMDHPDEALLMLNVAFQKECAQEICQGICDFFGVKYDSGKTKDLGKKLGEVKLKQTMNYRAEPSLKAKILKQLPKGHKCHFYEEEGHWLRLGVGWVSNAGGKYVEILERYDQKPEKKPAKKRIYRVIVDGKQIGAYAEDSNVIREAENAIKQGKSNIKIEEV